MQVYSHTIPLEARSRQNFILEWKNLSYILSKQGKSQSILKSVSGYAQSGQILAVMGPSGSGKTTLLSLLSNRLFSYHGLKTEGEVTLNKVSIKDFQSAHYMKYVFQEDNLFVTQTPREAFTFACRLKVPQLPLSQVAERVNETLEHLRLQDVADKLIGSATIKGLSGGEKKRVSIGNELISYPNVLILDEPTSGLDSWNALHLIEILKKQADMGKMIIFTIHQPNTKMFRMIDRLILMSEGNFLYQGPAAEAVYHFANIGYECPEHVNPPEYFMRLFHVEDRFNFSQSEAEIMENCLNYYREQSKLMILPDYSDLDDIKSHGKVHNASTFTQLAVISKRALHNVTRQKMLSVVKMVQAIFIGAVIVLVYHNNSNDLRSVQNITGVLFFLSIAMISPAILSQILTFPLEKAAFFTEYREGLYGVVSYYISKFLCEMIFQVAFVLLMSLIVYFAIPLNYGSADKFFVFVGVCFTAQLTGSAMGYLAGSIFNNVSVAMVLGPFMMVAFVTFGGFFSNAKSLAAGFSWVQYLSSYGYCYRGLILNQFTGFIMENENQKNPIDVLGFNGEIWENVGAQLLLMAGMSIISMISLKISGEYHKKH